MDAEEVRKSLLGKFREVTADRLEKVGIALLALEKDTAAPGPYDDVARELHTLKGEARMLSLPAIAEVAHAAEDLLKASRDRRVHGNATDLMLRACDAIGELAEDLAAAEKEHPPSAALRAQILSAIVPAAAKAPAPKGEAELAGPAPQPEPTAEAQHQPAARVDRSIRVSVDTLDELGSISGDLIVEGERAQVRSREMATLMGRVGSLSDRWLAAVEGMPEAQRRAAVSVFDIEAEIHRLRSDAFTFTRRRADGVHALQGAVDRLGGAVAKARLVPLSAVFAAFPRAVRDMAMAQGKEVELNIDNAGVGVDPSVVSEIRDALVHLLRNAVDHGIEKPSVRLERGKPRGGRIHIEVRADGDKLSVVVEDDGAGLDASELRRAAVNKGLLSEEKAAALSDRAAWELIFLPGFSTRRQVSEISGRGVGMDVVKQKVESLGGSVSVASREGAGLRVFLRLPQSLMLMEVLLLELAGEIYGLPASDVEGVGRVSPVDRAELAGTPVVTWRGRPVALTPLAPLLGVGVDVDAERPLAVFVRHGEDRAGFVVDGFLGEREVAVKPCGGRFLKGARFLGGAGVLEDGRVAVLLQVPDLMAAVRRSTAPSAAVRQSLKVLLVEDSAIARATEVAIVRSLGHAVAEAVDGVDAMQKLAAETFDLVIADIQMPRMDGFALTRKIKSDPALSRLPVVILSSLAAPEDKRKGLDAGADAYLVKGELTPESLAQVLGRLT